MCIYPSWMKKQMQPAELTPTSTLHQPFRTQTFAVSCLAYCDLHTDLALRNPQIQLVK